MSLSSGFSSAAYTEAPYHETAYRNITPEARSCSNTCCQTVRAKRIQCQVI